tara:strand:- start:1720 stop:2823 length:1104 start_codon:yes stop_codon:yes gene_type:complete
MKELEAKLLKAKIELMTRSAFISTIALSLKHVITSDTQTADVNGYVIRYNPEFIKNQTVTQFAGLVAHECWHVAFQHLSRRGSRDPIIWNVAGDYIINHMLTKAGFQIPTGGLLDNKYDHTWSTDQVYDELMKNQTDFDTSGLMLDLNEDGALEDDGGIGSSITNTIVRARTQAQISGEEKAGLIPDEILRRIEELLNPKLPWQVILAKFLDTRIREEYSWARKNRRYPTDYLPSLHSYGLGNLTFAIDTSGSIDNDALKDMLSEIQGIQQVFNPEHMTVIDCDSVIHQIHDVDQSTNILDLKFVGGGGTRFQPVLDYVENHPTQALIYFTDLEGESDLRDIDCPIIWICTSDHEPSSIGETIYMNN